MTGERPRFDVLGVIALGGVVGATARYALAEVVPLPDNGFPVATLITNVLGSLLLGFIAVVGVGLPPPMQYFRPFFAIGVIGSFTTFSTFAVENVVLVDRGEVLVAAIYVPAMLVAGIGAAWLGVQVARRLARRSGFE